MRNPNFTTKQEYLAYRSEWKVEYKELSQKLRDMKFCRWYERLGEKRLNALPPYMHSRYIGLSQYHGTTSWAIIKEKLKATCMLGELKVAKEEAQRQYLASKTEMATV